MDPLAADPPRSSDQEISAVWGPVATILWTLVIALAFLITQILTATIYAIVTLRHLSGAEAQAAIREMPFDATFLFCCTFAGLLVCVPLIVVIVKLKRGAKPTNYLGLNLPRLRQFLLWSLILSVVSGLIGLTSSLLNRPTPEFMLKVYASADSPWLLWLTVAVDAPVFEEICFRGFIFKGLAESRWRWSGATIITSVLWAAIHLQYGPYEISTIFALGLVLGTARAMTNSTLLTMWLHCLFNILATVGMEIGLKQIPGNN
jgi:membrane protease YdiL (CAAX protease family)